MWVNVHQFWFVVSGVRVVRNFLLLVADFRFQQIETLFGQVDFRPELLILFDDLLLASKAVETCVSVLFNASPDR